MGYTIRYGYDVSLEFSPIASDVQVKYTRQRSKIIESQILHARMSFGSRGLGLLCGLGKSRSMMEFGGNAASSVEYHACRIRLIGIYTCPTSKHQMQQQRPWNKFWAVGWLLQIRTRVAAAFTTYNGCLRHHSGYACRYG